MSTTSAMAPNTPPMIPRPVAVTADSMRCPGACWNTSCQLGGVSSETRFDPLQSRLCSGQSIALVTHGPARLVQTVLTLVLKALALVLQQFAFVRAPVTPVGDFVAHVREPIAGVGECVPKIPGCSACDRVRACDLTPICAFGGATLTLGT